MGDQLSLAFEPTPPAAPDTLRPMLARPASGPFDSPAHLFEPVWGGRRALAFLEPAVEEAPGGGFRTADGRPSVRLLDEAGEDCADRLPELSGLALRLEARSAVLDGEVVVVDRAGRADGAALRARLAGRPGPAVAYLAFDLLYVDGRPLLGRPLERRRAELGRVLRPGPDVVVVPAIAEEGLALFDAVVAQGLAGVSARVRTSPYLPGVRSRLWRFVAAGAAVAAADAGEGGEADLAAQDSGGVDGGGGASERPGAPNGPILALIQRLPLDDDG